MLNNEIRIWSKVCLACDMEEYCEMVDAMKSAGFFVCFRRTVIDPEWHKEASKIWGSENYPPFAEFANGTHVGVGLLWRMMKKHGVKTGIDKFKEKGNDREKANE